MDPHFLQHVKQETVKQILEVINIINYTRYVYECMRKQHNEEFHNLYSSPSIIRMIRSRRMRWAGNIARMG
jgi:hypothetical protein